MRQMTFSTMAMAFCAATAFLTGPAAATDTSKALTTCVSRGPDCTVANKNGGYEICVNNTGGKQCVNCPALTAKDQTCSTALRGGRKSIFGVQSVLQGGAGALVLPTR